MIQANEQRFKRIRKLYNRIAYLKYDFWIRYWYKRDKCPICHQKIRWEQEFESVWDTVGYAVPLHINEDQNDANKDEYCEGVC